GGDFLDFREKVRSQNAGVNVDVVDGGSIDAERGQHAAVVADAREIGAGAQVVPEDGSSAVAALDRAVEVVPVIHPADGHAGLFGFVQIRDGLAERDLSQQS